MSKQILIVGAGASGMAAAIFAARKGARVTILEQNDRPGRKLAATGNGRCNFEEFPAATLGKCLCNFREFPLAKNTRSLVIPTRLM